MSESIKKITEYLEQNKSAFSRETLTETLLKAGYGPDDVRKGVSTVYGNGTAENGFWNLDAKKNYADSSEKWLDVLFGFAFSLLLAAASIFLPFLGIFIFYILSIVLIIFFSSRRPFFTIGLAIDLLIGPAAIGILAELLNINFYHSFF